MRSAKNSPFATSLKGSAKKTELIEEKKPPRLPEPYYFAWSYFMKLHQTRGQGGLGGFLPITYQEMLAMFQLEQSWPLPYEIDVIRQFDRTFLEVQNEQMKREQKSSKKLK